jgi:hypothetical protein
MLRMTPHMMCVVEMYFIRGLCVLFEEVYAIWKTWVTKGKHFLMLTSNCRYY